MDALQFTLFFVALLVAYVLVHLRLVRFEENLQKLAGIRGLDDRLRALDDRMAQLGESFDKVRLDRVEAQLQRLHEDLETLHEATADVRHAVVQVPPPEVAGARAEDSVARETAGTRLIMLVETRLLQLGYHDPRLLTDLGDVPLDREIEVQVEAWRGGMPVKGRVLLRNGSVRDVAMQTVAPMFP
jgi:hypothetical protein